MTTEHENNNGHQPEEQLPDRRAGVEELFALERGGGFGYSFNPIEALSQGSIKPEEWLPRSQFDMWDINLRCLRMGAKHTARYGWTNTDAVDWYKDHMKMALDRRARREIVEMATAILNRDRDVRNDRFSQMGSGFNPPPNNNNGRIASPMN